MVDVTLQIPDQLAQELNRAGQDFTRQMLEKGLRAWKIEQALLAYARGGMTLGAAARLAGVPADEMARQAYAQGFEPHFSDQTLAEELGV